MLNWKRGLDGSYLNTLDGKFVLKDDFESLFGNENTYEGLMNHPNVTNGWKEIFKHWKNKGILN